MPEYRGGVLSSPTERRPWAYGDAEDGVIDVSVCIVNWNCRDLLRQCLRSLREQPQGVTLEIIVVDNASNDGAADMVAGTGTACAFSQTSTSRNPPWTWGKRIALP